MCKDLKCNTMYSPLDGAKKGEESHPLVSSLAPRIQFLGKVSQVVVVVEVAEGNQILEEDQRYLRDEKKKKTLPV